MPSSDKVSFLASWLRNPLRVASVTPSSTATAALITREIGPETGVVMELGPGTGPFTRALLDRGVAESDLVLIERDADFAQLLHKRFPQARILEMDADAVADQTELQAGSIGAVVSGLGLSMMPDGKIADILDSAFRLLKPNGAFFQLTYHPRCPVSRKILDQRGLEARRIGKTLRNLPPASIYRIARRAPELA